MNLSAKQEDALRLILAGKTGEEIARRCNVCPSTVDKWRARPEFQAALAEYRAAWRTRSIKDGIADQQRRLYRLNDRWRARRQSSKSDARWLQVQRDEPDKVIPPGVTTGVLDSDGYVDVALMRELREHEAQAARELCTVGGRGAAQQARNRRRSASGGARSLQGHRVPARGAPARDGRRRPRSRSVEVTMRCKRAHASPDPRFGAACFLHRLASELTRAAQRLRPPGPSRTLGFSSAERRKA